jgi:hypothetical protein
MSISAAEIFFGNAIQYYVAGRYATLVWLNPVAGNLLHHAVEMCLKGALSKAGMSLPELEKLKHHLPKIWKAFKAQAGDTNLDKSDRAVRALHAFEKLRYPDSVLKVGMQSAISLRKTTSGPTGSQRPGREPKYEFCLEDIDEIFGAVFKAARVNAKAFTCGLHEEAKQYLTKENMWMVV